MLFFHLLLVHALVNIWGFSFCLCWLFTNGILLNHFQFARLQISLEIINLLSFLSTNNKALVLLFKYFPLYLFRRNQLKFANLTTEINWINLQSPLPFFYQKRFILTFWIYALGCILRYGLSFLWFNCNNSLTSTMLIVNLLSELLLRAVLGTFNHTDLSCVAQTVV